ncbi:LPS-assembly protein LptD [Luteimonas sp. e5]
MRRRLRLLPLSFAIACALPATAQQLHEHEMQPDYSLCPAEDAVPVFPDAPPPTRLRTDREARRQMDTELAGDEQSGTYEVPVLSGNVTLRRGDQFLGTDNITFDSEAGTYVAEGSVRFQDSGMRITAERASGNQNEDSHRLENLRYQLTDRRGNGGADLIEVRDDVGSLHGASYSTCPPSQPQWKLVANRIDFDTDEGFAVARNATFRVGRIPVLYMPWFKFPIDERRQTGLLMPSISNSGRNGFYYKQPIYFNLAPNYDLTLSPRIMTKRGPALGSEFRYLLPAGAGEFNAFWMPDDKLRDRSRSYFSYNGYQNLSQNWQFNASVAKFSDPRYFEDFTSSALGGIAWHTTRSVLGVYGRGRHWSAGVMADHNQLSDYTLTELSLPFDRLPRAYLSWEQPIGTLLRAGIDSEAVRFRHSSWRALDAEFNPIGPKIAVPGGNRLDLKPWISMPLQGASWFIEPRLAWRHTRYQLDDALARQIAEQRARADAGSQGIPYDPGMDAAFFDKQPSRSLPIFSLDAGVQFDREFQRKGEGHVQTLEPRLFYLNVPYRNQDALPLFDTQPLTFGWGQLFRDNRYTSADRQSDANQITTAVTTRILRDRDGFERFNASIGQIHYLDDVRVMAAGHERTIERGRSAWVADTNWAPSDRWLIGASYQWDPKYRRQDLASLRARYLLGDDGVVNIGYRYRRDLLELADFSFLYPINPAWSLVGRYYYSIKDRKPLETVAGVQWDSCCVAMRLVARQYIRDREGDLNNAIMFELEFKGLGSAGQDTRRALRRAILGYYRDDLYLVPPQSIDGVGKPDNDPPDASLP